MTGRRGFRHPIPRRRIAALGGVLAGCVIALAIIAPGNTSTHTTPPVASHALTSDSVAVLDAVSGAVRADIPVGHYPGPVILLDGSSWVCDREDRTLTEINASSFVTENVVGLPQSPHSVAATGKQLWVGLGFTGEIARVDTATNQITSGFYPARPVGGFLDMAGSPSGVWVGTSDARLIRLDTGSAAAGVQVVLPERSVDVVASGTQAWTVTAQSEIFRITSRSPADRLTTLPDPPAGIALGYRSVWVATTSNVLYRLAADTGRITARFQLQGAPTALAVGDGAAWIAESPRGLLERIPISRGQPRATFDLGYPIGGLALSGTSLWASLDHR